MKELSSTALSEEWKELGLHACTRSTAMSSAVTNTWKHLLGTAYEHFSAITCYNDFISILQKFTRLSMAKRNFFCPVPRKLQHGAEALRLLQQKLSTGECLFSNSPTAKLLIAGSRFTNRLRHRMEFCCWFTLLVIHWLIALPLHYNSLLAVSSHSFIWYV